MTPVIDALAFVAAACEKVRAGWTYRMRRIESFAYVEDALVEVESGIEETLDVIASLQPIRQTARANALDETIDPDGLVASYIERSCLTLHATIDKVRDMVRILALGSPAETQPVIQQHLNQMYTVRRRVCVLLSEFRFDIEDHDLNLHTGPYEGFESMHDLMEHVRSM